MSNLQNILIKVVAISFLLIISSFAKADIIVPFQKLDQVDVSIEVDVQYDGASQLYTYNYSVTSLTSSIQNVESFAVEFDGEVLNIQSPVGWKDFMFDDESLLMWGSIIAIPRPADYVDTGNVLPGLHDIKPGETLSGFSFQSPELPQTSRYFAQGFAPIPQADHEGELDVPENQLTFTQNSKSGLTIGPGLDDSLIFHGGRRPSVDGFLAFVGSQNRETRSAPTSIIIRFGVNGETVNVSTFKASLNRVDVTGTFKPTGNGEERLGIFDISNSPLVTGRNVLNTAVDGIVPGTTRTASDGDSFTFFVQ